MIVIVCTTKSNNKHDPSLVKCQTAFKKIQTNKVSAERPSLPQFLLFVWANVHLAINHRSPKSWRKERNLYKFEEKNLVWATLEVNYTRVRGKQPAIPLEMLLKVEDQKCVLKKEDFEDVHRGR